MPASFAINLYNENFQLRQRAEIEAIVDDLYVSRGMRSKNYNMVYSYQVDNAHYITEKLIRRGLYQETRIGDPILIYYAINQPSISQITTSIVERDQLILMIITNIGLWGWILMCCWEFIYNLTTISIMRCYGEPVIGKLVDIEVIANGKYQQDLNLSIEFISPKTSQLIQGIKRYKNHPIGIPLPTVGRSVIIFH